MNHARAILYAALVLLAACSDAGWQTRDISNLMPPLSFTLTDENGAAATADDFRGEAALLFFGFASCRDVCPATLARLALLLEELPETVRANVRVLFVSVDPGRDTPEDLRQYTDLFGPRFIGLTGTQEQLRTLNKRYRVTYGYGEPDENGFYHVAHSGAVFGFSPDGAARILVRDTDPDEAVLADLRRLARSR